MTLLAAAVSTDLVRTLAARVDAELQALPLPAVPATLYEPVRYVLSADGKRARPVLLLLTAGACGVATDEALPAALAVEVFHNFTLVHDDIMDRAATRRGRPTVHTKWDEPTAILSGDLLYALAYDLLLRLPPHRLAAVMPPFQWMVARLCEGQALDMEFAQRQDVTVADYLDMIARKTGALIEATFLIGGLLGGVEEPVLAALRRAGREAGRAFQIQDDLLDLTAEDDGWGKTIGGDLIEGKKAYLLLRALERAEGEDAAWFRQIVAEKGLLPERVPEARDRLQHLGVLDEAASVARAHYEAALTYLQVLPPSPSAEALEGFVRKMQARTR